MKKPLFKALVIILLIEILLVGFSLVGGKVPSVTYFSIENLFDFRVAKRNLKADTIIAKLSVKDTVELIEEMSPFNSPHPIKIDTVVELLDTSVYLTNPFVKPDVQALDDFYRSLYLVNDSVSLRIAHYGDSQLEGDRLTCFIRKQFQRKFGGYGIGYVPLTDITTHEHMLRNNSDNWIRYSVFNKRYTNGNYCASGLLFKYTNTLKNPLLPNEYTANLEFDLYKTFRYDHISLMYTSDRPCTLVTSNAKNKTKVSVDSLYPTAGFAVKKLSVPANYRSLKFEFSSAESPDFYGFLIDGIGGVQMDNYAIRGHSGERMLYADAAFVAKQLTLLNTKLLILQYGANVVPYFDTKKKCNYLEQVYYGLFMRYKTSLPGVSVLVIGPGDMASAQNGQYVSYDNVPMVRDAQRRAALRAGCAFWDIYEAMGGQGSILTWADKGMASRDGHFYRGGQVIVAKQFFEALMVDYNNYLYRQTKKLIAKQ